jgi:hypothetical protein
VRRTVLGGLLVLGAMARPAAAGDNDLNLSRLGRVVEGPGGMPVGVTGQNLEYRTLVSELGVALAPRLLAPADTNGFGGFQFSADVGYTSISAEDSWWRVRDGTGSTLQTLGVFARKGMWLPVPSIELGAGMVHLMDSGLWTGQTYAKLALHEGYHDLPVPSVAVRGAVSRLMGSKEIDLTVASLDISISKQVGIGGTWTAEPYGGWDFLIIVPRSEVLDATPGVDPLAPGNEMDSNLDFVFKDQQDIFRHRFFVGARMQYYVFDLTLEAAFALKGSSKDDRTGTDMPCTIDATTTSCDSTDQAAAQSTFTAALGLDF